MMEDSKEHNSYIDSLINGISSLLTDMKAIMTVLCRKKTAKQHLENQKTLELSEYFRGTLTIPHNEQNEHHCVACGLCQMACPNNTIKVASGTIETEDSKKKKILTRYECDLGSYIFCQPCVSACPHDVITFDQNFEHAVFDHSKLVLTPNHPDSYVEEKKKSAAPQAKIMK